MKTIAIHSGCDWYDASVEYINTPDEFNIKIAKEAYDKWYREVYVSELKACKNFGEPKLPKYLNFVSWIKANYTEVRDSNLEIFEVG